MESTSLHTAQAPKRTFRQKLKAKEVGIYWTIIVHLLLFILLISIGIKQNLNTDNIVMIDIAPKESFESEAVPDLPASKEEVDRMEGEVEAAKKHLSSLEQEVDRMIAAHKRGELRNVAVNQSDVDKLNSQLRDGKGIDANKLYEDARKIQQQMDANRQTMNDLQGGEAVPMGSDNPQEKQTKVNPYTGPSVLSYSLDGRRAMRLPVPVYKCNGGGDVKVDIEVNQQGFVTSVSINVSGSTENNCLHDAAKQAALSSRFSVDSNSPKKQKGVIIYRFIPQ